MATLDVFVGKSNPYQHPPHDVHIACVPFLHTRKLFPGVADDKCSIFMYVVVVLD